MKIVIVQADAKMNLFAQNFRDHTLRRQRLTQSTINRFGQGFGLAKLAEFTDAQESIQFIALSQTQTRGFSSRLQIAQSAILGFIHFGISKV